MDGGCLSRDLERLGHAPVVSISSPAFKQGINTGLHRFHLNSYRSFQLNRHDNFQKKCRPIIFPVVSDRGRKDGGKLPETYLVVPRSDTVQLLYLFIYAGKTWQESIFSRIP